MNLRINSAFVSIGAFLRLGVTLVSIPVLVRFLGLERYGIWIVLNSMVAIGALMELGISTAATYRISSSYAKQDWLGTKHGLSTAFILMTCLGIITSLGLWIASSSLIDILFRNNQIGRLEALPALNLLSWSILLVFWQKWAMAVEAALLRYDLQAIVETISGIILQLGIVVIALAKGGLLMLVIWSVIITGLTLVGHYLILKHLMIIRLFWIRFSWQEARDLLHFGIMQWLSSLGSTLFGQADKIIVNLILGAGATGIYSAVTSIAAQINKLSAIPLQVIPPAISAAKALSQNSRIRHIFIHATRLNGLLVLIITTAILFWAPQISNLLVGRGNNETTAEILRILAFAYGIYSLSAAGFFSAIGVGFPIINARWGIVGAIISLFMLAYFASRTGLSGAAWGNIGYVLVLIINFQIVKIIDLDYRTYIRIFFPSISIITLWWLMSTYINIGVLPFWALIFFFILLLIPSIIFVSGSILIRELADMTFQIYKSGIFFMKGILNGDKH